jgi:hypothetical protein
LEPAELSAGSFLFVIIAISFFSMLQRIFFVFISSCILVACFALNEGRSQDRWDFINTLPLNGSGYFMTPIGADFWRSQTNLSSKAWNALPLFLQKTNLSSLQSLREMGGHTLLSPELCYRLYLQYNVNAHQKLTDERCGYNHQANRKEFMSYGQPLVFILQQFDHYLLLYVGEEGLGAPVMYFYSYNLETGRITSLDINFLNTHIGDISYENGTLHFFNMGCTPCDTRMECPIEEIATFDLQTELFNIRENVTRYDCPASAPTD